MDNLPVNITDIAVIVVVLVSAFLAYARGFVHEVLSVAGWVGAGFITAHALPFVEPFALELIPIEKVAPFAAGAVVFIVSLVILSILTRAISRRVQDSAHNALDRSLGFLFGMVRGAVLVCLIYIAIEWMMLHQWITRFADFVSLNAKGQYRVDWEAEYAEFAELYELEI